MKEIKKYLVVLGLVINILMTNNSNAQSTPVAIDSRIKTFIYSENEVFRLVVHYGYQSSIEFADGEEIQTISVGNNYAWQLTPVGRRLFIKPLEENILTNMTIITNKRVYHLEVQSKLLSYTVDEELVYVVRFFYPDQDYDTTKSQVISHDVEPIPSIKPFNFNYTLTGPESIAPIKVFDDGTNTFFKFDDKLQIIPSIATKVDEGVLPLEPRKRGDYIVVDRVANEFELKLNSNVVNVFNENLLKESE